MISEAKQEAELLRRVLYLQLNYLITNIFR